MDKIEKSLRKLSSKKRSLIEAVIMKLLHRQFDSLDIKKLKGIDNHFRVRVGNYRIVFFDVEKNLKIKSILKRDDKTYKNMK